MTTPYTAGDLPPLPQSDDELRELLERAWNRGRNSAFGDLRKDGFFKNRESIAQRVDLLEAAVSEILRRSTNNQPTDQPDEEDSEDAE